MNATSTPLRRQLTRRLWSAVRRLPQRESTMRDMVAVLRQEDETGRELLGTDEYTSTRRLTVRQLRTLVDRVEDAGRRAAGPRRRARGPAKMVWFVSEPERKYIRFLAQSLGWSDVVLEEFALRQTGGRGVRTHKDASAAIEPMERMLRDERGWTCTEAHGRKWWDPPAATATGGT